MTVILSAMPVTMFVICILGVCGAAYHMLKKRAQLKRALKRHDIEEGKKAYWQRQTEQMALERLSTEQHSET